MLKNRFKKALIVLILLGAGCVAWFALTSSRAPEHPFYQAATFDVIAHRGGAGIMPENTLEAMILSERLGVDILEMDIRLTKDRQIVVIHDETLNRTTSCNGLVAQITLAELSRCKIKSDLVTVDSAFAKDSFSPEHSFITIPTLETVLQRFPTRRMVIEIKGETPELVTEFCRLIRHANKTSQILVGSFRQSALDHFREICPEVATSASPKEAALFVLLSKIRLAFLLSPAATALQIPRRFIAKKGSLLPDFEIVTAALIRQAHAKNLAVQVWTVNDPTEMTELIGLGVDGIMTDFPDRLLAVAPRSAQTTPEQQNPNQ